MIILLFIESRLNFKNIPLNSTFKSSINYQYIVYRNENPISCFLEFLVSLNLTSQWRNVAPVAPASPGGAIRRGRQNFELKLFGCKNVPYVGLINVRWWGKKYLGYKKLQGAQEAYKKNRKNSGDLFF